MMRAPTLAAVHAVELRVAQAARNTVISLGQARTAMRAEIVRPRTLALVAAGTGVLGWWLAGRRPRPVKAPAAPAGAGRKRAVVGSVLAFIMRYQMQGLPFILTQVASAWRQRRASSVRPGAADAASAQYAASRLHH